MSGPDWAVGGALVLGARGMLGRELVRALKQHLSEMGGSRVVGWGRPQLDICDRDAVLTAIGELKPSIVLNAAAYTGVDACETNAEQATAVNAEGPGHVAAACRTVGAVLVQFGTDFIFDGVQDRPYTSEDRANPLSVYGRSKWEGEQVVRSAGCRHLIVRTSWLFGRSGHNFVEAILSRARRGGSINVVSDQVGRPTLAGDLAEAVVALLGCRARGTYHFASSGQCSWFEFAREIIRLTGMEATAVPITSELSARPAQRPAYSVLDTGKYTELTGQTPPEWQDALRRYLAARSS